MTKMMNQIKIILHYGSIVFGFSIQNQYFMS